MCYFVNGLILPLMELNYKIYGQGYPLLILHGLLGSLDNWQSIAKALSEQYMVITIDARNHGRSPHADAFNYEVMVADLLEFMEQQYIFEAYLLGHSMGGKTVMQFAQQNEAMVKKLIVADIAPISYAAHHDDVFAGLKAVNLDEALQRADVEKIIAQHVKENDTVQFLMKALYRKEDHSFGWRFNLDSIQHSYQNILGYVDNGEVYDGPTLFLRGDKSRYIQERDFSVMKKIFPNYELASLDAGHWLHAERPREFVEKVVAFLG